MRTIANLFIPKTSTIYFAMRTMSNLVIPKTSAGLTLRQNKHVLRASMGKDSPQKSGNKTIYFTSQILDSKSY